MIYDYSAINLEGKRTKGVCEAEDENDLYKRLKISGFFLIRASVKNTQNNVFYNSIDIKTVSILCKQISSLMHAGMELAEAVNICSEECKKKGYRRSLKYAYIGILKGDNLNQCLEEYSSLYPKFMIDMIRIGEESGTLVEILHNLSQYYYKEMKLQSKIRTSLFYPILLGICMIVVSLIVTTKIIPEFQGAINVTGSEMPALTSMLISINNFCSNNCIPIIIILALVTVFFRYYLSSQKGLNLLSSIQISLFPLNKIFFRLAQIKITGSMYILLSSGHNAVKSLGISRGVLRNILLKQRITICIEEIERGKSFSKALESTEIFDNAFLSMVRIGEEIGNIKDTIEEVIRINQDNMEEDISRVVVLIEPVMLIIAALIVTFIVFAALLPELKIMDSLGGN
jgi:type IV pilus assembly protein PilC